MNHHLKNKNQHPLVGYFILTFRKPHFFFIKLKLLHHQILLHHRHDGILNYEDGNIHIIVYHLIRIIMKKIIILTMMMKKKKKKKKMEHLMLWSSSTIIQVFPYIDSFSFYKIYICRWKWRSSRWWWCCLHN
jgi:hypothetical protein